MEDTTEVNSNAIIRYEPILVDSNTIVKCRNCGLEKKITVMGNHLNPCEKCKVKQVMALKKKACKRYYFSPAFKEKRHAQYLERRLVKKAEKACDPEPIISHIGWFKVPEYNPLWVPSNLLEKRVTDPPNKVDYIYLFQIICILNIL